MIAFLVANTWRSWRAALALSLVGLMTIAPEVTWGDPAVVFDQSERRVLSLLLDSSAGHRIAASALGASQNSMLGLSTETKARKILAQAEKDPSFARALKTGLQDALAKGRQGRRLEQVAPAFTLKLDGSAWRYETADVSITQEARQAFIDRAKRGDVDVKLGKNALVAAEKLSSIAGQSILGSGISTCYLSFGPKAVQTLNHILVQLAQETNPDNFHKATVRNYSRLMGVPESEGELRVCALSGREKTGRASCEIFSGPIAAGCR